MNFFIGRTNVQLNNSMAHLIRMYIHGRIKPKPEREQMILQHNEL